MARRRKKDDGSCLGTIIMICLLAAFIGWIGAYIPYILMIAGAVILIYIIARIIERNNNSSSVVTRRSVAQSNTQTKANVPVSTGDKGIVREFNVNENAFCKNIDTRIRSVLTKREIIKDNIHDLEKEYRRNDHFWNKNDPLCLKAKSRLSDKLDKQRRKLNSTYFNFSEETTNTYFEMKKSLIDLKVSAVTPRNGSPAISKLFYDYNDSFGDMSALKFDVEPFCILAGNNIFCITPHYILIFAKNGRYLNTCNASVITASGGNRHWVERIPHTRYLHQRVDGGPDLRYSHNPLQTYYTEVPHTDYDGLHICLPGYEVEYSASDTLMDGVKDAINEYSHTTPQMTVDSVYQIVRLLKMCEPNDWYIPEIEEEIGYGI